MPVDFDDPLGVDFACLEDIDASLSLVDGRTQLGQAVGRRLITARGNLFYDANYGEDVRQFLKAPTKETRVARKVENEVIKDDRVDSTVIDVTFTEQTENLSIGIELDDGDGPFDLVLNVDGVTVELLNEDVE